MEEPSQVSTYRRGPRPVDEDEEWQRYLRRLRAKAHADQARRALEEARRNRMADAS